MLRESKRSLISGAGVGAAVGLGVEILSVGVGVLGLGVADLMGSGGSVATGGTNALVGAGVGVRFGVAAGVRAAVAAVVGAGAAGAGVLGLGVAVTGRASTGAERTGTGVAPGPLTVVDDPAGTETSAPPALVSTVPAIVTTLVSPFGETVTYESDPARITDAIPALRTSYRLPRATALVTAYQTRPSVCCMRTA